MTEKARRRHCTFCGEEHHNRRDYMECRKRGGAKPAEPKAAGSPRAGSPTTRYQNDPLRGDKRAHAIVKKARSGMPPRKIAKALNVPLNLVEDVLSIR